ncbi:MAG TPA: HIT family protein [Kiritimatiellia bacterium]|nr:HIT family protein [Kiritimatiellia bacterium]
MSTIFTKILSGEIPCHRIAEDERYFAFLDIRPVRPGHTLVIPKQEVDYLFDMEDEPLGGIMIFSKRIARALKQVVPCAKVGVMVAGLEVRHAHVHLIPFHAISDLSFANARAEEPATLAALADKIRTAME